jgi:hypothetical protein
MGFTEILTIVFIVLKLVGVISWGWFYVLLPEIIAIALYVIGFIVYAIFYFRAERRFKNFK